MAAKRPSLDEWLEQNAPARSSYWNDVLPDDVKEQLITSDASTARCVAWLQSIGFEDATAQKIDNQRRKERQRRERQTDPG